MSLNSFKFVVMFCAFSFIMILLQGLRKKTIFFAKVQKILILLASYVLIFMADWRFCACIFGVTVICYLVAIKIESSSSKFWLTGGVFVLVGILGYFKYTNFFVESFCRLMGREFISLNIILPIGVSFYIFSALSYLIDVYRKEYQAEKNFETVALYIAFFPKLAAGPIIRAKDFFPQLRNYRGIEWSEFLIGIQVFVFGLFKKMVLADHIGVFVDDVFRAPLAFDTGTVILAAISYSLQIYLDFSGYSDMAIGISRILGFDFAPNFNLPYMAGSVSEFWQRWHISLSNWFRDYLYIPMGGNRKGTIRTYFNLMVVMIVSGIWHGAGWTFIVWGFLHGIACCVNKAIGEKAKNLGTVINVIITFIIVTLFWVVFRANSVSNAFTMLTAMFTVHTGISQPYTWSLFGICCLLVASIIAGIHSKKCNLQKNDRKMLINGFYPILDLSKIWSLVLFFTFCGLTLMLGYYGGTAFIYSSF